MASCADDADHPHLVQPEAPVQCNTSHKATLLAASKDPDNYRNFVRISS